MTLPYYPGCDLYTKAKPLNTSIIASFRALDVELKELANWYCCGTTFTLARDNRMSLIAPLRILARAQKEGESIIVPCSICYNTLKRANYIFNEDREGLEIINEHLGEKYDGKEKIVHPFEFFAGHQDLVKSKVRKNLAGVKLGCYYGCYLLRPSREIGFDDPESPTLIENFARLLGAEPVSFPLKVECCGSYLIVNSPDAALEASYRILNNARGAGAEVLITSCPLCHYNLDTLQKRIGYKYPKFAPMPIFYFSQIMAIAFGIAREFWGLEQNKVSPEKFLKEHALT